MTLRVNRDDLVTSGVQIAGHGEDVATHHFAADRRIDAARGGWQGLSATAMVACSEKWVATTQALLTRLSHHAQGLHISAHCFDQMEGRNSQALGPPGRTAEAITGTTAL